MMISDIQLKFFTVTNGLYNREINASIISNKFVVDSDRVTWQENKVCIYKV